MWGGQRSQLGCHHSPQFLGYQGGWDPELPDEVHPAGTGSKHLRIQLPGLCLEMAKLRSPIWGNSARTGLRGQVAGQAMWNDFAGWTPAQQGTTPAPCCRTCKRITRLGSPGLITGLARGGRGSKVQAGTRGRGRTGNTGTRGQRVSPLLRLGSGPSVHKSNFKSVKMTF